MIQHSFPTRLSSDLESRTIDVARGLPLDDHDVAARGPVQQLPDEIRRRGLLHFHQAIEFAALDRAAYHTRFASDALADLSQMHELVEHGLATLTHERLLLTESGMERSDAIGPWLYTAHVQTLMEAYELR